MAKKTVELTFINKTKKLVAVGDSVYSVTTGNKKEGASLTIKIIGNKFVTLSDNSQFIIETGIQNIESNSKTILYPDQESYESSQQLIRMNSRFKNEISKAKEWTQDQIEQAAKILNINL